MIECEVDEFEENLRPPSHAAPPPPPPHTAAAVGTDPEPTKPQQKEIGTSIRKMIIEVPSDSSIVDSSLDLVEEPVTKFSLEIPELTVVNIDSPSRAFLSQKTNNSQNTVKRPLSSFVTVCDEEVSHTRQSLCEEIIKCGNLWKRSRDKQFFSRVLGMKNWKERSFVLKGSQELFYYKRNHDGQVLSISISSILICNLI